MRVCVVHPAPIRGKSKTISMAILKLVVNTKSSYCARSELQLQVKPSNNMEKIDLDQSALKAVDDYWEYRRFVWRVSFD